MQEHRRKNLDLMTLTRSISELATPYTEKDDLEPLKKALGSNMQGMAALATTEHMMQPFLDLQTSDPPTNGFQPQVLLACSMQEPVDHKWSTQPGIFMHGSSPCLLGPSVQVTALRPGSWRAE